MSIEVKGVTKHYGSQKALDSVSFKVDKGEILGFIGPNGAGKSTMMKIITGYLPADAGTVVVNGIDVGKDPIPAKRCIGYLPEHNPLYLYMYVREYLEFTAGIYGMKKNLRQRVSEMIDQTGLGREQYKQIGMLSKGYRQRVGLAQALIHDPDILILDEPTSGLDPNQLVEIRNLISEVGRNKTVMLSTHIMQEVEAICHRILLINGGRIAADDQTANLVSEVHEGNQILIVEFNKEVPDGDLLAIEGIRDVKHIKDFQWIISGSVEPDVRNGIFAFAVARGLVVLSMQRREKSLEEIFRELTNLP